jgi:hypothetical protein
MEREKNRGQEASKLSNSAKGRRMARRLVRWWWRWRYSGLCACRQVPFGGFSGIVFTPICSRGTTPRPAAGRD